MNVFQFNIFLKSQLARIIFLILTTILVYFNSLKGPFQYDDFLLIQQRYFKDLNYFWNDVQFIPKDNFNLRYLGNRPSLIFTFALNYHLTTHKEVFGFHLVKILMHIGVVLLIYFILSSRWHSICRPSLNLLFNISFLLFNFSN